MIGSIPYDMAKGETMNANAKKGIGRWHGLVIDCPEPAELANFYEGLLGMVRVQDEGDWVVIGDAADRPGLAFQRSPGHVPPAWPSDEAAQQMHLDVRVEDLDEGHRAVVALGARLLHDPGEGAVFRVFTDPAGHPFCLIR